MTRKPRASQNQIEPRGLPRRVEFTATGLRLPSDLTEEEWKNTGKALSGLDHALDWAIGDWLNAGEDRGYVARDRYTLALELFPGRKRRTLQNLAYEARSVESSRRREDLGLGRHAEVAALPANDQIRWLERAAEQNLTVLALRGAIVTELRSRPGLTDPDDAPDDPSEADSYVQFGDLYALGDHRIVCGDAADSRSYLWLLCGDDPRYAEEEDLGEILADRRADMIWTDPPYGKGLKTPKWRRIANDDLRGQALRGFLGDTLGWAAEFADRGAAAWVCCNWEEVDMFIAALRDDIGLSYDGLVEWNKLSMGPGGDDLRPQHEFVIYHAGEQWLGGRHTVNVKDLRRDNAKEYTHPTQKPVELIEYHLGLSSAVGQTVLDPFLGSGSTIIAAESTGRRCLGIERDRAYVQVAIERWERYTGRKAEKLGTEDLPEEVPPESTWWEAIGHTTPPAERRWNRGQYPLRLADNKRHVRHRGQNPLREAKRRLARLRRLGRGSGGSAPGEEHPS